jgi:hypothetical protein
MVLNDLTSTFITHWDLSETGSGDTQLSFGTETSGEVSYIWKTVPASSSGFGTFTGNTLALTNLPAGATIDLVINPTNFQRINIGLGTDRNRLST